MKIKILKGRKLIDNFELVKGQVYELLDIVEGVYMIDFPRRRKGYSWNVLVEDQDGELID